MTADGAATRAIVREVGKRFLADFRDHRLRLVVFAKVRQQQEQAGQPFLARIEQLIDEVCFDPEGPAQKMRNEHLGECWFLNAG